MKKALSETFFWLALAALAGAGVSIVRALTADQGLEDLGWFVFGLLLVAVAGGLMGGYLLTAPPRAPKWRLALATVLAVVTLLAMGGFLTEGADAGVRVLVFVGALAVPALLGLVRSPRSWRG